MTCPKCGGSGYVRSDEWGVYWTCWQCSAQRDLSQSHDNRWERFMQEPALGVRGITRPKHIEGGQGGQQGG